MGRYDALLEEPQKAAEKVEPNPAEKKSPTLPLHTPKTTPAQNNQHTQNTLNQSVNQSINQLTGQSINQLTQHLDERMMNKPKGFYISDKLDKRFDKAVEYFEEKHRLKTDRSILLNALLEDDKVWDEPSLDRLINRLINQLTRKLTNR